MAKRLAVVIQEDPRKSHRPVEALRIALGLVAGSHMTTVVLLGEAVRLLSQDVDDVIDGEILEKYLPSIQQLDVPFILPVDADCSMFQSSFSVRCERPEAIRSLVRSMDCTIVF